MKRLISDQELRVKLEEAYEVGFKAGGYEAIQYDGRPFVVTFDEWYEGVYGGPDCE